MKRKFAKEHDYRAATSCNSCNYCTTREGDDTSFYCTHPEVGFTDVEGFAVCDCYEERTKKKDVKNDITEFFWDEYHNKGAYLSDIAVAAKRKFMEIRTYSFDNDECVLNITLWFYKKETIKISLDATWKEEFDEKVQNIVDFKYYGSEEQSITDIMDRIRALPEVTRVDLRYDSGTGRTLVVCTRNMYELKIPL